MQAAIDPEDINIIKDVTKKFHNDRDAMRTASFSQNDIKQQQQKLPLQNRVPFIDLKKVPITREDQLRSMKILTNQNMNTSPMQIQELTNNHLAQFPRQGPLQKENL